jgi:hypothetical protein
VRQATGKWVNTSGEGGNSPKWRRRRRFENITRQKRPRHKSCTDDCPWCPGTAGTVDCPSVTEFWNRFAMILQELLGPHPLQKKRILHGYSTLHSTPPKLANYLLVPAKTYLATSITHRHTPEPAWGYSTGCTQRCTTACGPMKRIHWLHSDILGKVHDGKIILSEQI